MIISNSRREYGVFEAFVQMAYKYLLEIFSGDVERLTKTSRS